MKKEFAVIGLGRFGSSLARTLHELGCEVLGLDSDAGRVQHLAEDIDHVIQIDATDDEALKAVGIGNFDVVVVAIGQDLQASILVTVILKELGVPKVVAKALNRKHGLVLERIGADKVVYPERDMGIRLAHSLIAPNMLDMIELSEEYSIVEVEATDKISGKTLAQLALRPRFGISVIAIRKKGEMVVVAPGANDIIELGDVVVAVGKNKALEHLEEK